MYPGGLEIGEEEKKQVIEALDRKYLFRYYGPKDHSSKVRELEVKFANKMLSTYALATSNCTGTLISSLVACGVGSGDEVIVSGYTFFASCVAIVGAKAIPVIVETDKTLTINLSDVEKKITGSTKALLVVHMRGVPCKKDSIMDIAKKHDLKVIEDVAQALTAEGINATGVYNSSISDWYIYAHWTHVLEQKSANLKDVYGLVHITKVKR